MAAVTKYLVIVNASVELGGTPEVVNGVWDSEAEAQAWVDAVLESYAPSYLRIIAAQTWEE